MSYKAILRITKNFKASISKPWEKVELSDITLALICAMADEVETLENRIKKLEKLNNENN